MTLLAKVFTGLIFVLSVIFFSFAVAVNATHINQKALAAKFQAQATAAQQKNTELETLLEELKDELAINQAARRSALATLQSQLAAKNDELEKKEMELEEKQKSVTLLSATEKQTQLDLKALTDDNELLRKQMVNTREDRNQIFQRLVTTKDQLNRMQGKLQSTEERAKQVSDQLSKAGVILEKIDVRPETLLTAPPVNGLVTAVSTAGLVEVSLGRDDGMREGFTLEVHRSGQYLGRLKVKRVEDNKSVAEILTSYQKGYIRAGDRVDSSLF